MARNFDDLLSEERSFIVRGETFVWKEVRPEVLEEMGKRLAEAGEKDTSDWESIDAQIMSFLYEKDHDRWRALRAREEEPVTIRQLGAILSFLVEEQTERPTQTPSPSDSGRGRTAPTSKAA